MPFAAILGGLAQFLAGMWAYKARDGVAIPTGAWPEVAFWFIVLAAITWAGAGASLAESKGFFVVLLFLAAGSTCGAIALLASIEAIEILAGWLLIISSIAAWYTASALMLHQAYGREVWRLGRTRHAREMPPITAGVGEPGVIRGQA